VLIVLYVSLWDRFLDYSGIKSGGPPGWPTLIMFGRWLQNRQGSGRWRLGHGYYQYGVFPMRGIPRTGHSPCVAGPTALPGLLVLRGRFEIVEPGLVTASQSMHQSHLCVPLGLV
jgi:hypothetical protein